MSQGQKLALLHIDGEVGSVHGGGGGGQQQVDLAAEEGGNLEHIHHFGHRGGLMTLVDIGERPQTKTPLHLSQHLQALSTPGPRNAPPALRLAMSKLALNT